MEIVVKQADLPKLRKELTHQEPFPPHIPCKRRDCSNKNAQLLMLVRDVDKELVKQRPPNVRVWLHDSSIIAIYFCTECGSMRARWNQA